MADRYHFIALDLGAESGRSELVTLADGVVSMTETHRFPNQPVRLGGTLHWDFPALFREIQTGIANTLASCRVPDGIAVDTWGVDFGLLGSDGALLGNPVGYRDSRTDGVVEKAGQVMPLDQIWAHTALQTMQINSLYQLHAMQLGKSPLLSIADGFGMIADLINYFLTGKLRCELSTVQTSQLIDTKRKWCMPIIEAFGLPKGMFGDLVEPGTVLGPVTGDVAAQVGLSRDVPIIACAAHDTSSAVAAVPAEGTDWAFLSCGTWSIMGTMLDEPVTDPRAHQTGWSNEYTYGQWYFARNILGLWLVQQLRRKWDTPEDVWDYDRMTRAAGDAKGGLLVDVDAPTLMAPDDMEAALVDLIVQSGQPAPESRGQLLRCVLESLALQYAHCLEQIRQITGRTINRLYLVGGGCRNTVLCQATANATGIEVHAGADQCTAMGNALGQALAIGVLKSPDDIRQVMRASFPLTVYEPRDPDAWAEKRARYADLSAGGLWS